MIDLKRFEAVLFDLDDTLYSRAEAAAMTYPGMFAACLYPNRSRSFLEEAANYMMAHANPVSMVHEETFRTLFKRYPPDVEYDRDLCVRYYSDHITDFVRPFPETLPLLKLLKQNGVRTAIVTNITPERLASQKKKVHVMQLEPYLDAVLYSGELGIHKPDRRIFDCAAACLGVANENCLFVGDDFTSDVQGALGADMEAVWIDRFHHGLPPMETCTIHHVGSIGELYTYFCRHFDSSR